MLKQLKHFPKLVGTALLTGATMACSTVATPVDKCAGLPGPCSATSDILVLAPEDMASPLLAEATRGAAKFQTYFGVKASPIAIVPGQGITPEITSALEKNDIQLSLPWLSASDKQQMLEASVRKQVEAQTKDLPIEVREAAIKQALAQIGAGKAAGNQMSDTEKGALTHELGHLWFVAAFSPAQSVAEGEHGYGGWAPDWLDETAAVLLENESLTVSRLEAFRETDPDDLYPLEVFLTMEHPALKAAQALAAQRKEQGLTPAEGTSKAIVLSGEEAAAFLKSTEGGDPVRFYSQVRAFANFIMETTGNEMVFADLATSLSEGSSIEEWLKTQQTLPNNIEGLSKAWLEWIKAGR